MTKNEQISNVMGWEYFPESGPFPFHNGDQWFDLTPWEVVKEMQAKMVADGHQVIISQDNEHFTSAIAFVLNKEMEWDEIDVYINRIDATAELAAIVELFCRVYGIK